MTDCAANGVFQATYWPMMFGRLPMLWANLATGASESADPRGLDAQELA